VAVVLHTLLQQAVVQVAVEVLAVQAQQELLIKDLLVVLVQSLIMAVAVALVQLVLMVMEQTLVAMEVLALPQQ
jgi:hypothetical protein